MIKVFHDLVHTTPPIERVLLLFGNVSSWVLGAASSQSFMWVCGGLASLSTAFYVLLKAYYLIQSHAAKDAMDAILDVDPEVKKITERERIKKETSRTRVKGRSFRND